MKIKEFKIICIGKNDMHYKKELIGKTLIVNMHQDDIAYWGNGWYGLNGKIKETDEYFNFYRIRLKEIK